MKFRFKRLWFLLLLPLGLLGAVFYVWSVRPTIWQLEGASALELSEDGRVLVAQNYNLARVYDCRWKRVIGEVSFSPGVWGEGVRVSEDGSRLICVSKAHNGENRLEVFGVGTVFIRRIWTAPIPPTTKFLDARFVGRRLQVLYNDGITTFSPVGKVEGTIGFTGSPSVNDSTAGRLSPDGSTAVVCAQEGLSFRVIVFDARKGQYIKDWPAKAYEFDELCGLCAFEFSRDGRTLTACSIHFMFHAGDGTWMGRFYWSLPDGKLLQFLHGSGPLHSPFSPDGQAGLREDTNRFWFENIRSKASTPANIQIPPPLEAEKAWITDVRLSSDGHTIAALNEKGQIWLQKR